MNSDVLARRAKHCVTHHAGCDCREHRMELLREAVRKCAAIIAEDYPYISAMKGDSREKYLDAAEAIGAVGEWPEV